MDLNLAEFRTFCRAYINDMVVASGEFDEHLYYLGLVFQRLQDLNIKIEPMKAFIGFLSVQLLG